MSAELLRVENVSLATGRNSDQRTLVRGVSFAVREGEVTALIGSSGSGKSLSCLAGLGLLPPGVRRTAGRVTLHGRDLDALSEAEHRRMLGREAALIMQNPMTCFDPLHTVASHFRETVQAHEPGKPKPERFAKALSRVGFERPETVLPLFPFEMSGGMLQRVMIALALACGARLLVADEPTTDLDVVAQARILDILDGLRREQGLGILLVTHDLSIVARLAGEVCVMHHGEVVERGPVQAIFDAPRHPVTRELLRAHHDLSGLSPLAETCGV
jgi:nickel transport system ATP-binding protein